MKNFEVQWKALKSRKDDINPTIPKISKSLPIIKWTEAFHDFLNRIIGIRTIPLAYVIRTKVDVPGVAPPLAPQQPHLILQGSAEGELVAHCRGLSNHQVKYTTIGCNGHLGLL